MATREVLKTKIQDIVISKNLWSPFLCPELPQKWENHGNCIIFSATTFQSQIWSDPELTNALYPQICDLMKITKIARRTGSIVNNCAFRRPQVEILYDSSSNNTDCNLHGGPGPKPEPDGWVAKTENGIKYTWDVTRCMFSSGNITEKQRISSWDLRGQVVVDLYAGIGYFTLSYLVHAKASLVYACEWNPDAIQALRKNLILNKIPENRCIVLPGDNLQNCPKNVADHVNLGLIPSSGASWGVACSALKVKTGGILHVHGNVDLKKSQDYEESVNSERKKSSIPIAWGNWSKDACTKINQILNSTCTNSEDDSGNNHQNVQWCTNVIKILKIKSYGPCVDHIVVDVKCIPVETPV